jgi:hypothetical protein
MQLFLLESVKEKFFKDNLFQVLLYGGIVIKHYLKIFGMVVLVIVVELNGCIEQKDNTENSVENLFIGTWKTTPYYTIEGERFEEPSSTATIFENGTMRSESVYEEITMWNPYTLDDTYFCLGDIQNVTCYKYSFSDNGDMITLFTPYQDPYTGENIEIFIELNKI